MSLESIWVSKIRMTNGEIESIGGSLLSIPNLIESMSTMSNQSLAIYDFWYICVMNGSNIPYDN